ncbi:OsmC family peroxiredoxin [Cytophagales bacterium RKSG123]|nr:OsmC family peroxiredoxin [Xanthovirga aplysinae]
MAKTIINGVNVNELTETINAIKKEPELGKFKFRARNTWVEGGNNKSRIKSFYGAGEEDKNRTQSFVLEADEPQILLGKDKGPNPVEIALHALAACLTSTFIYYAAARGIEVEKLESKLEGELDVRGFLDLSKDVRNGFQNIKVNFTVKSNASEEQLEDLCELAQKHSPVFDIVTNQVPVEVNIQRKTGGAQRMAA